MTDPECTDGTELTLWLHTLEGRHFVSDSADHTMLYLHYPELDDLCRRLGVTPLSDFFDRADLTFDLDAFLDDPEAQPDPETGWNYGIDDMQWFAAPAGMVTLTALQQHLPTLSEPHLQADWAALQTELADCVRMLQPIAERDGLFHLAVIM